MRTARVVALVVGAAMALIGIGLLIGGGLLGAASAFGRDDGGYFQVDVDRLQSPTAAIRSEDIDLLTNPGSPDWLIDRIDSSIRIETQAVDPGSDVFVGIGPEADVASFLDGVAYDEIVEFDGRAPVYRRTPGDNVATPPTDETFWVATATNGEPLEWEPESGRWVIVLMNADGSPGVTADVVVGARFGALVPLIIVLVVLGVVAIAAAVVLIVVGASSRHDSDAERSTIARVGEPTLDQAYPVALSAGLDSDLSRWKWLVKWLLAIPHVIVLVLLWIAFIVATFVAGVGILFTARYPKGMWRFNVGVLRWTWRVRYYAFDGGLGTDRYPPFSLGREPDYPAVLDIVYPEQLSRGLVLVKWWLLAIPHYVILAILFGGAFGNNDRWAGGLVGVLVLIAAVILLASDRYPTSLFDLTVGLNRWLYRVIAYAALMTDQYPPFRLDQGGREPGSPLPPPAGGPAGDPVGRPVATDAGPTALTRNRV